MPIENDRYLTPDWLVRQCVTNVVSRVCPGYPRRILDPGAGEGVFTRHLRQRFPASHITAVDMQEHPIPEATEMVATDFLAHTFDEKFDLAIGNPPFRLAVPFILQTRTIAQTTVFLLRQGFLSSAKRSLFLQANRPSDVFILAHRPTFNGADTSDKADYCFVVWGGANSDNTTRLHWLPTIPVAERT